MKILVVDDDPAMLIVAALALEKIGGHEVLQAQDGAEAIQCAKEKRPDAILMDMVMPEISGFDVLSAISQVRPNSKCVVVISAAASQRIGEAESPLVRARLRKPFEISDLVAAVRGCSNSDTRRASS